MGPQPLFPLARLSQYSWILLPIGVRAPRPVTTTRFNSIEEFLFCSFYISNCLTNSSNVFSLVVWNLDVEFFFELHDKLYRIQGVCSKVISEAGVIYNFVFVYT